MRLVLQHRSAYRYATPAALGPHLLRLRPCTHTRARVEAYSLTVRPEGALRWQQDPAGNHLARVSWRAGLRAEALEVLVELAVDVRPVNPFDFFLEDYARATPFAYAPALRHELAPYMLSPRDEARPGSRLEAFLEGLPREGDTVSLVVELNARVHRAVRYVIREEAGVWSPEETLAEGRASCRDSATLLVCALRHRGFAARFVSGYLVQLTDEGMIPDEPRGVGRDVVDLHAWAEVYLPGAGWIGLDATSGLLCGEGHIPLACAADAALAAPLEGTASEPTAAVDFAMTVARVGHEARPTRPFSDEVWARLLAAGDGVDAALEGAGLALTMGGEPTFNAREHAELPEWNGEALGPTKWRLGWRFAEALTARLAPGALVLYRQGKRYPGEPLPRWSLDVVGRRDGAPVWSEAPSRACPEPEAFARALAARLGLDDALMPAYEDPWRYLQEEASLPVDVDPLEHDLGDPDARRRLAAVLDRGMGAPVAWVLPLRREGGRFVGQRWRFRRGHLFLLVGDSPVGMRLPLRALTPGDDPPEPPRDHAPDPRLEDPADRDAQQQRLDAPAPRPRAPGDAGIRTALCVERRGEEVYVFLPPAHDDAGWFALVAAVDDTRRALGCDVRLEGYGPPEGGGLVRFAVTPDPGVLELNLPVTRTSREYVDLVERAFDAALHAGLHAEKYLLDGRQAASGGGNHLTLGGPTALESPFLRHPDLLASLLTFVQHHPSMSFLFTGLFVGPTSQAPRVDEARHDALYELEIALEHAFATRDAPERPPPWLCDMLFRHLLVDVAGNTHRAEVCIDKLFDPYTPHGRQGLVELRAFEMPPHPRMMAAQMILARALVAAFARAPYRHPLVRWGAALHDRFLLPHFLWRDFEDVLRALADRGLHLPPEAWRPFLELRCPRIGVLEVDGITLTLRNAIEPWPVLGEEHTASGTSRFVDSSMERVELTADGLVPERHVVTVNGRALPMRPTGRAGVSVAGVRFRAWAPPHSLQPHLGVHHPLRFDVVDTWARRSLGSCSYHVWHPEGRAWETAPLTRFEADARRAQRFTVDGPSPLPLRPMAATPSDEAPCTLDLRRYAMDRAVPGAEDFAEAQRHATRG